ncbi:MAG: hypothetical protein ACK4UQ_06160 [Brevundimonas sp.]
MQRIIPALALALVAGPGLAQEAVAPPEAQPIFREGDAAMTCRQISDEAAALSAQMGGAQGGGVFSSVVDVGRAGAAMLIPGAGLAIAGVDALNRPGRERREAREAAVEQRWYYLNGLYTGLRCGEPTAESPAN